MGIFFAFIAAILVSISNFCMRRSIDAGGSSKAYLVVQLTFSFLVMIVLNPVRTGDYAWSFGPVAIGLVGGLIFGIMMWGLGKTLEKGPPGLTFAILNTSSVAPAIVLALFFGVAFGHPYTFSNGIGSLLVVVGLLWAGWTSEKNANKAIWVLFATLIFILHTLFLVFLQWWAMVLKPELPTSFLLPFHIDARHIQWFMPAVIFVGAAMQWVIYIKQRHHFPKGAEIGYGIAGGITNGACTFFLILAPQVASSWENAMIFPIFSVGVILLCNLWAQVFYKEAVNWWANAVCVTGLVIGTVAWQAL
ncbi:MAG: hypothetical protein S4CHLAM2_03400 [Chlamydiales bacterium]|nr:hypothetical protein [Chlamydiales bacterium]